MRKIIVESRTEISALVESIIKDQTDYVHIPYILSEISKRGYAISGANADGRIADILLSNPHYLFDSRKGWKLKSL